MISISNDKFINALKCPLTGRLFDEPVLYKGVVYEKAMLHIYGKYKRKLPNGDIFDCKYVHTVNPIKSFIKTVIEHNPQMIDQLFNIKTINIDEFKNDYCCVKNYISMIIENNNIADMHKLKQYYHFELGDMFNSCTKLYKFLVTLNKNPEIFIHILDNCVDLDTCTFTNTTFYNTRIYLMNTLCSSDFRTINHIGTYIKKLISKKVSIKTRCFNDGAILHQLAYHSGNEELIKLMLKEYSEDFEKICDNVMLRLIIRNYPVEFQKYIIALMVDRNIKFTTEKLKSCYGITTVDNSVLIELNKLHQN